MYMCKEADRSLVTATVPVVERFGWTTFGAVAWKQVSRIVDTTAGEVTTVDTVTMSLFRAIIDLRIQVLLQTNGLILCVRNRITKKVLRERRSPPLPNYGNSD